MTSAAGAQNLTTDLSVEDLRARIKLIGGGDPDRAREQTHRRGEDRRNDGAHVPTRRHVHVRYRF
jgi:hypothetical protein